MPESLIIDCPELSGIGGKFISEGSCKQYPRNSDNYPVIITTMPQVATSPPNTGSSTSETNTRHPGEPKKENAGRFGKGQAQIRH